MLSNSMKKISQVMLVYLLTWGLVFPSFIFAGNLPTGGNIAAGNATITSGDTNLDINQSSHKAISKWDNFSIGKGYTVNVNQCSSCIHLAKDVGGNISTLRGILNSQGNFWLSNRAGIFVGSTGVFNVSNLLLTTLDISDNNFMAGNYHFSQDPNSPLSYIFNQGIINAADGGSISLIAPSVINEGIISANLGKVYAAAGEEAVISFDSDGLIGFTIDGPIAEDIIGPDGQPVSANIQNMGTISANGGEVVLQAKTAYDIIKSVVNNEGIIEARSFTNRNGVIILDGGDNGIVENSGIITASAAEAGADGGYIEITGQVIENAGIISADAGDNATAGNINVIAQELLTLEETSLVSARGDEVNSHGGDIYLYSYDDAYALAGQVIDFSGGTTSGDGGTGEMSSADHVAFSGSVFGYSQGGDQGSFIIDPITASVGPSTYSSDTTVWAEAEITIDGDVTLDTSSGDVTLYLLADHDSSTVGDWAGGVGAITRSGNYTISESPGGNTASLYLYAGKGDGGNKDSIGSSAIPIQTDVDNLYLATNPDYVDDYNAYVTDSGAVTIMSADIGGTLDITSTNNLSIDAIDAATVYLTSTGGSITDNGSTITATSIDLLAATGIDVHTDTTSLEAVNTASGNISITEDDTGSADGLTIDGNGVTNAGNGTITIDTPLGLTVNSGIKGGGNINLDADGLVDVNANIDASAVGEIDIDSINGGITIDSSRLSGYSVDLNTDPTGVVTLDDATVFGIGWVLIHDDAVLAGGTTSIVSSENGDVDFNETITGTGSLEANALNGGVNFRGAVGGANDPLGIVVNAGNTLFSSTVEVGTNGLTVNGLGNTTTLSGNVTSGGDVEINDNVVLLLGGPGTITIDTTANNSKVEINGTVNATTATVESFAITSGSGAVTLGDAVGDKVAVNNLTITSTGQTTLAGSIEANTDVDLSAATNVDIANDLTITAGQDVFLTGGAVDGTHELTVGAARDIFTGAMGQDILNPLTNLIMFAGNEMTIGGNVTAVDIEMAAYTDDLNLNGTVTAQNEVLLYAGNDVLINSGLQADVGGGEVRAMNDITVGAAADIDSGADMLFLADNGSVTLTNGSAIDIRGNLTITTSSGGALNLGTDINTASDPSGDVIIGGGDVTLNDDVTITSRGGNIDLNVTVNSDGTARNLTLVADDGTVFAEGLGTGTALSDLDIDADLAELNGDIVAETVDTTGVGLTTLTNSVDIDTTAGTTVDLGDLDGANDLTISAGGAVTLRDADIASVDIDDATTVDFTGDFVTSGGVTVDTDITDDVSVSGTIQAGGAVNLTTTDAGTPNQGDILISGMVSGNSVTLATEDGDVVNLDGATVSASGGSVDIQDDVTLTAATTSIVSSENGDVDFDGTVTGTGSLEANALNGGVNFRGAVGGASDPLGIVVNAGDTLFGSTVEVGANGLTVNGLGNTTTLSGNVTSAGDVEINDNVVLSLGGVGTVTIDTTANNSKVDINGTVNATTATDESFAITSGSGAVTLGDAVGDKVAVNNLTIISTGQTTLAGSIEANTDVDLSAATNVDIANDLTIQAGNDVLLTGGAVDGSHELTVTAGNDVTTGAMGQDVLNPMTDLVMAAGNEMTIGGNVTAVNVSMAAGADDLNLNGTITAQNNVLLYAGNDVLINSGLQAGVGGGEVRAMNDITVGAAADIDSGADMLFLADNGSVTLTNGSAIDIRGDLIITTGTGGGEGLFIGTDINVGQDDPNGDIIISGGPMTLADDVTMRTRAGNMDFNVDILGTASNYDLTLTADNGDISLQQVGTGPAVPHVAAPSADMGALTVSSSGSNTITLNGSIYTDEEVVQFYGDVKLGTDVVINTTNNAENTGANGADILFGDNDGADPLDSLSGSHDLWLDAGDGNISLDNVTELTNLTIDDYEDPASGAGAADVDIWGVLAIPGDVDIDASGIVSILIGIIDDDVDWSAAQINITESLVVTGNHHINLTATGMGIGADDGDINIGNLVESSSGDITLVADDDVVFNKSIGQIKTAGTVDITANSGNDEDGRGIVELDNDFTGDTSDDADDAAEIIGGTVILTVNGGFIGQMDEDGTLEAGEYLEIDAIDASSLDATALGDGDINIADINDLWIGSVNADTGDVNLAAGGFMNDSNTTNDVAIDVRGDNINLDAVTGIGNLYQLELVLTDDGGTENVSLDTLTGDIDVDVVASGAGVVTLTSMTTALGDMEYTQTGNVGLTVTNAVTGDGDIKIQATTDSTADTMTLTTVTAGGDGDVDASTTGATSGNIVVGVVTAVDNAVTLTTADGSINDAEAGEETNIDVKAGDIILTGGAGIGVAGNPLDTMTTGSSIDASTTGAAAHIDIDNTTTVDTTLTATTTGTDANITFDQDGGGDLDVVSATTTDGDIDISVDSGDLTATSITAGTDGNVLLDTTTSGNIRLHSVTAVEDLVTIDSVEMIIDGDDPLYDDDDVTAGSLSMTAVTGIGDDSGASGGLETALQAAGPAAGTLAATTASGDIRVENTGSLIIGTIGSVTGVSITAGAAGDDIVVTAASPLTVSSAVTNTGGGDITLAAEGDTAADILAIDAAVTATGVTATGDYGDIYLYAGGNITQGAGVTVSASGSGTAYETDGNISYAAGVDYNGGTLIAGFANSDIIMDQLARAMIGTDITPGTGMITMSATDHVVLGSHLSGGLMTGGTVMITANDSTYVAGDSDGSINARDHLGVPGLEIAAPTIELYAISGIGGDDRVGTYPDSEILHIEGADVMGSVTGFDADINIDNAAIGDTVVSLMTSGDADTPSGLPIGSNIIYNQTGGFVLDISAMTDDGDIIIDNNSDIIARYLSAGDNDGLMKDPKHIINQEGDAFLTATGGGDITIMDIIATDTVYLTAATGDINGVKDFSRTRHTVNSWGVGEGVVDAYRAVIRTGTIGLEFTPVLNIEYLDLVLTDVKRLRSGWMLKGPRFDDPRKIITSSNNDLRALGVVRIGNWYFENPANNSQRNRDLSEAYYTYINNIISVFADELSLSDEAWRYRTFYEEPPVVMDFSLLMPLGETGLLERR